MTTEKLGSLGWGRFIIQFVLVMLVYFAASVPAVVMFGMTSAGLLGSVAGSMAAALLLAWFWLRRDGHVAEAWNLRAPDSWARTLLLAALAAGLIIAWFQIGAWIAGQLGISAPDVVAVMDFVTESPLSLLLWIVVVAIFAAGFGEELLWRGFLFDRLQRLRGIGDKTWLVIVVQAVLFGLPHAYQGLGGMLITGVVGLGLGWLRVRCGGNLWACIIAHAAVDVLMMSVAYADKVGALPGAG